MDEWFDLIVGAVKQKNAHPDSRRSAIVRVGQIAASYEGCSEDILTEVFGATSVDQHPERAEESQQ
jgi:hypothetical protein